MPIDILFVDLAALVLAGAIAWYFRLFRRS
jgi:hypothetical protein